MYALITGASSGIGKETALLLAKKGYNLIIAARREKRLIGLKNQIAKLYDIDIVIKTCDISNTENITNLYNECQKYDINVVVNNAGFGKIGFFTEIPAESELQMINTNITALYLLTKLFANSMEKGYILNIASSAAFLPDPKMAVYGATKSFVFNFSNAVNYELKRQKKDVSVSVLCPGPVNTEFNDVAGGSFNIKAMTAKRCAQIGVKGMFNKKSVIIPGALMKISRFFLPLLPAKLLLMLSYNIQSNKMNKK